MIRSKDHGANWGEPSIIARGYNEVCATQLSDGRLMACIRKGDTQAGLYVVFSSDNGFHWTAPKPLTQAHEHPGDLLRLRSGEILLSFGERNKPYGVQALVSGDEGRSWDDQKRYLLVTDGDHEDLGYPVTIERKDGKLVTIYYIVYGKENRFKFEGAAPDQAYVKALIWSRK
jgi:hypothetical protein